MAAASEPPSPPELLPVLLEDSGDPVGVVGVGELLDCEVTPAPVCVASVDCTDARLPVDVGVTEEELELTTGSTRLK